MVLRAGIAAILLFVLIRAVDPGDLAGLWRSVQLGWVAGAVAILVAIRILMAVRWRYILLPHGVDARLSDIIAIIFISTSAGYLLPAGGFGVDVYRGYQLSRLYGSIPQVSATIVVDRVIGLFSMVFLALCGVLVIRDSSLPSGLLIMLYLANAAFLVGMLVLLLWEHRLKGVFGWLMARMPRLLSPMEIFAHALMDSRLFRQVLPGIFSVSVLVQLLRAVVFYMIYRSLGADPGLGIMVVYIPLVFIVILMPISLGGLGVRELALQFFLAAHGLDMATNLSAGLMFHALEVLVAIPGVYFFLFHSREPREQTEP
jgi:uncharacterized protein (TIRG00374 family)